MLLLLMKDRAILSTMESHIKIL